MRLIIMVLSMLMLSLGANAAAFEKSVTGRTGTVLVSAEKPIVVGVNTLRLHVQHKGEDVEGDVSVKVFMPAMPGMPYMEDKAVAKTVDSGTYEVDIALSMGGTWQIHIFVAPRNGKKFRLKSSINI